MSDADEKFLTVEQAAEAAQLSKMTIYRAIWEGDLPASKWRRRVRIRERDLQAVLDKNRYSAKVAA